MRVQCTKPLPCTGSTARLEPQQQNPYGYNAFFVFQPFPLTGITHLRPLTPPAWVMG